MDARNWRSRDPGGAHGAPARSVTDVVLCIQRTLGAACWLESALLCVAGASLALALIAHEGGDPRGLAARCLAVFVGLLTGAAWQREHHQNPTAIARKLDACMRHQGSLVTAYELEATSAPTAMGRLLVSRVLARLRLREALRAMFPSLVVPIAAPLLGLGLLALSMDAQREAARATAELSGLTAGLVGSLTGLGQAAIAAGEAGEITSDTLRELLSLSDRTKSLERRTELLQGDPERAQQELAELAQDTADMAARLQHLPELSAPLERAGNWMDAARMELEASARLGMQNSNAKPATGAAGTVTAGAEKGSMSGLGSSGMPENPQAEPVVEPPLTPSTLIPLPSQPSSGALAAETWPTEYDAIISGWIELQRRTTQPNDR